MRKREVKLVLFDLDGVLVDSIDAWHHVFNDTLTYFYLKKVSKREFRKDFGAPIEHDMKKYFKGKTVKEVVSVFVSNFKKSAVHVKLFPQSMYVLKNLKKKNVKTGLITNSTKPIVLTVLNDLKLKEYFNVVVTMDDVRRRKPAPDMVLKACKKLKVSPKNTILIGDTINDILAGKRAGCITIGYKTNSQFRISNLKEILEYVK